MINDNGVRVRDRNGELAFRANGVLLDGDQTIVDDGQCVRVPMWLADSAQPTASGAQAERERTAGVFETMERIKN